MTYTENGENDRDYQFGHETTASLGASYQTQSPWGFNAELLYRHTERDERASASIPNTGGKWLDFVPAVQYHINDSLALRAAAKIPLSRDLNDQLQFTTKYAVRLTVSYIFGD
jgi:long-subunit fatty acid transport protein